jgi:MSHA pilin protein MshC
MTRQKGFTMVELVMVIVILGVLAVVALPKLTGTSLFAASAFRSEVVSALRYAQKSAVSHRRLVCATLSVSAVTLAIAADNPATSCGTTLASPDSSAYQSKDSSVAASGTPLTTGLFFQPSGVVTTTGAGTTLVAGTAGEVGITEQAKIKIEGATGYVE